MNRKVRKKTLNELNFSYMHGMVWYGIYINGSNLFWSKIYSLARLNGVHAQQAPWYVLESIVHTYHHPNKLTTSPNSCGTHKSAFQYKYKHNEQRVCGIGELGMLEWCWGQGLARLGSEKKECSIQFRIHRDKRW